MERSQRVPREPTVPEPINVVSRNRHRLRHVRSSGSIGLPRRPNCAYTVPMGMTPLGPDLAGPSSGSIADANLGSQTFVAAVPLNSFPDPRNSDPKTSRARLCTPQRVVSPEQMRSRTPPPIQTGLPRHRIPSPCSDTTPPTISSFSPLSGVEGGQVDDHGDEPGVPPHVVLHGVPATVVGATPTTLVVTVPNGHVSGGITVSTPGGSAMSVQPFEFIGPGFLLSVTTSTFQRPFLGPGTCFRCTPSTEWRPSGGRSRAAPYREAFRMSP